MTGAPLPEGADTVVQVEHVEERAGRVYVRRAPAVGRNLRRAGEDVRRGDVVLPRGSHIGPAELGVLTSIDVAELSVARRPRVGILATGSELVPPGRPLGPGQIRNSNSFTAWGQVLAADAVPVMLGIAADDPDETRRLISRALEEDVVITSGGVSVGDYDFVKQVEEELGVETPLLGRRHQAGQAGRLRRARRRLVFGAPGNPVAAMVSFELYVRPALLAMQGRRDIWRPWSRPSPPSPSSPRKTVSRCAAACCCATTTAPGASRPRGRRARPSCARWCWPTVSSSCPRPTPAAGSATLTSSCCSRARGRSGRRYPG